MSYLRTFGYVGDRVATLGWILLIVASAVVLVVTALVVAGVWRRGTRAPAPVERGGAGLGWVVIGGIVVPTIVLAGTLVVTVMTQAAVAAPASPPALTVRVIGHQWWWEVRYLDRSPELPTTANEIHIPVGRPVKFEVVTGDVIHSFWIPELSGKTDLIPGQTNVTWLEADRPGTYRGQCAEYCGAEHAKMALEVVAESPGRFRTWLDDQRAPASTPTDSDQAAGAVVFATQACALCHTVAGTPAQGHLGPDLTHLASRQTIAAGTLPNSRGNLAGWIADPQTIKPGTLMPRVKLTPTELQVLVTYLQSLR